MVQTLLMCCKRRAFGAGFTLKTAVSRTKTQALEDEQASP
jgi:hypothetical protein